MEKKMKKLFVGMMFVLVGAQQAKADHRDITVRTCTSINPQLTAVLAFNIFGEFNVEMTSPDPQYQYTSNCNPIISSFGQRHQIQALNCDGKWANGDAGQAVLASADGVLNQLIVQLPNSSTRTFLSCK
jgi:hypothetical protein